MYATMKTKDTNFKGSIRLSAAKLYQSLLALFLGSVIFLRASAIWAQASAPNTAKPPYNVVFIIVDQQTDRLLAGSDYSLPALDAIASHGVRFPESLHRLGHVLAVARNVPHRPATPVSSRD